MFQKGLTLCQNQVKLCGHFLPKITWDDCAKWISFLQTPWCWCIDCDCTVMIVKVVVTWDEFSLDIWATKRKEATTADLTNNQQQKAKAKAWRKGQIENRCRGAHSMAFHLAMMNIAGKNDMIVNIYSYLRTTFESFTTPTFNVFTTSYGWQSTA